METAVKNWQEPGFDPIPEYTGEQTEFTSLSRQIIGFITKLWSILTIFPYNILVLFKIYQIRHTGLDG